MTTPDDPERPPQELLGLPELAKAVESDDFKRILDSVPIAVVVSRLHGNLPRIIYVNTALEGLLGLSMADAQGRGWSVLDDFTHEDDPQVKLGEAIANGTEFLGTFRRERENKPVLVQAYAAMIEGDDGTENYRLAALVDVTERERSQREQFERDIRDKDLLLQEIQHRVKNNLQLIVALIRLEARQAKRGEEVDLARLAGRIEALRLLYEALTPSGVEQDIDLAHYLGQIASSVMRAHGRDGIRLDLKVGYAPVSVNVGLPVGLLVHELIINAFKHGFPNRDSGTITVECEREEDRYHIVVADDGEGLPEGTTWPAPGKLGNLVVQTLRENARLELRVDSAPGRGARVTIEFTHKPAKPRVN
jgi:PAS domain S-box-containing protein